MSTGQHRHWLRHRLRHLVICVVKMVRWFRFWLGSLGLIRHYEAGYEASQKPRMRLAMVVYKNWSNSRPYAPKRHEKTSALKHRHVSLAPWSTEKQLKKNWRPQAPSCFTSALKHRKTQTGAIPHSFTLFTFLTPFTYFTFSTLFHTVHIVHIVPIVPIVHTSTLPTFCSISVPCAGHLFLSMFHSGSSVAHVCSLLLISGWFR